MITFNYKFEVPSGPKYFLSFSDESVQDYDEEEYDYEVSGSDIFNALIDMYSRADKPVATQFVDICQEVGYAFITKEIVKNFIKNHSEDKITLEFLFEEFVGDSEFYTSNDFLMDQLKDYFEEIAYQCFRT